MKTCIRCSFEKAESEFYVRIPGRLHAACKSCHRAGKAASRERNPVSREKRNAYVARYKERHPDRVRAGERRRGLRRFGLTPAQYDAMFEAQSGLCAACAQPETAMNPRGVVKPLAVDHDHACCPGDWSCGRCIRGLLCHGCNTSLGLLNDSADRALALADYLTRSN